MMKPNQMTHLSVKGYLQEAANHATAGYWTEDDGGYHIARVNEYMIKVADALGFDLVKRQVPQEAHETMLAKRRAEDGQAEETLGF
jgi:hypothetical protein